MPGRVCSDRQLGSCVGLGARTVGSGRSAERVYKGMYVGRRWERAEDLSEDLSKRCYYIRIKVIVFLGFV